VTGTDFDSTFTLKADVLGFSPDEATVVSATEATLKWTKGVPIGSSSPKIWFEKDGIAHYTNNTLSFENIPSSSEVVSTSVTCSFAGGCTYEVEAKGLATSLSNTKNKL